MKLELNDKSKADLLYLTQKDSLSEAVIYALGCYLYMKSNAIIEELTQVLEPTFDEEDENVQKLNKAFNINSDYQEFSSGF